MQLYSQGMFLGRDGMFFSMDYSRKMEEGREKTITWKILQNHNINRDTHKLSLHFDAMVSPDNNYVNILQTARACGLKRFPLPYVLSNCHNTLCAVGGTILGDDHEFGLSCAQKYELTPNC